jgi:hypothetical protein
LIVLVFAATAAYAADWPPWLGPSRNGVSPETVSLAIGLDPRKQNISNAGRPIRLVDPSAKPLDQILKTV